MPQNYKVFLASSSPRRHELVGNLFSNFSILKPDYDEPQWKLGEKPEDFMRRCLSAKWKTAQELLPRSKKSLLIVADTMVELKGELLGKPESPRQAAQMLQKLSGSTHTVFTAYHWGLFASGGLLKARRRIVRSQVSFRGLGRKEIINYIASGEPMDKAGAYAFQGLGGSFIAATKGSYSNIIGFPVRSFLKDLESAKLY
jgi:septum formation protein